MTPNNVGFLWSSASNAEPQTVENALAQLVWLKQDGALTAYIACVHGHHVFGLYPACAQREVWQVGENPGQCCSVLP